MLHQHFANSLGFDTCHMSHPPTPHNSFGAEEQKAASCLVAISKARLSRTIQGVWKRRRYQSAHSKIPSAKESALFWTRDVVRVSYGIASSPHKITLKRNTDKLHSVLSTLSLGEQFWQPGGLDNCRIKTIFWHYRGRSVCIKHFAAAGITVRPSPKMTQHRFRGLDSRPSVTTRV